MELQDDSNILKCINYLKNGNQLTDNPFLASHYVDRYFEFLNTVLSLTQVSEKFQAVSDINSIDSND